MTKLPKNAVFPEEERKRGFMLEGSSFLSDNIHKIDTSEIRRVFDLAQRLENPINLSIGQSDLPVPLPVQEELIKAIRDGKTGYTPTAGILPLREAIAHKWQTQNGFAVSPENILVSAGVAPLLFLLFETIINPQDHVLLIDPYFLIYPALLKYRGARLHFLREDFDSDDIERLLEQKIPLKAIVFSTPSNPTGRILEKEKLSLLIKLADKTGALLVSDEIYEVFDYDKKFVSTASLYPTGTLTLSGLSKSHSMTGLRIGYIGAPENLAPIVRKMATLQQYTVVCAPQPSQWAAIVALSTPVSEGVARMGRRRDLCQRLLKQCTSFPSPDGAFYIYPEIPVDSSIFVEEAIHRRLLLVPGYIFSQNRYHVRISYAQREDVLEEGLQIFCDLVRQLREEPSKV
ncbi:MAG: aminotransferase class I/II-fold pyridoxal phosphate-dependent enzyme [Leptospiraceae bacterium]|nr:aminotransferase class I/II-fold pyridoxal phosphate-dependent enzyme [Leptospiraceae bacterium]MDW8307161.1 aminotransferase class I/II-fold pyridoxal phosphate-dependent enzyme [Leptospiraceae bacterium]